MRTKLFNMKCQIPTAKSLVTMIMLFIMIPGTQIFAQTPTVTVRLANPHYDCTIDRYCADVEFQADQDSVQLFGMNVRFFYDDALLELDGFSDFQGGYGLVAPIPPTVNMSGPGIGYSLFGFGAPGTGTADFVNGAIQLVDNNAAPIYIDTEGWTKIFQICFVVDDPNADPLNFCPPIVWDLEQNPANGGFLSGDDGVVMTVVAPPPAMSSPSLENVVQFNWVYTGPGTPPYGQPIAIECSIIDCNGSLNVLKTDSLDLGANGYLCSGDIILYDITIINTGIVPISNITVNDPGTLGLFCIPAAPFSLNPGDTVFCTASHIITQAEILAGSYTNIANATGTNPDGNLVSDLSDDPDNPTDIDPNQDGNPDDPTVTSLFLSQLSVFKTGVIDFGMNGTLQPGDQILYTISVRNSGNQTITNIVLSDPNAVNLGCSPVTPFSLLPGATANCSASHTITQADIDARSYTNSATATGLDPNGNPVSDVSDDTDDPTNIDPNDDCNPDDPTVTPLIPTPVIIVRFSNPHFDCTTEEYCVDVEFQADTDSLQLFGMNVRFFYDDNILELIDFRDYQGGYGPVSPDPPIINTSGPAGPALFNFAGPAEFVNGAIQLVDNMQPPIYLSTTGWTKLFQVCFNIDDPNPDVNSFCPSLVWDLEQEPDNGGFLVGDDGVVMTIVAPPPSMSAPVTENVLQYNWQYTGPGTPPYGEPIEQVCISINCAPMLTCAVDTTIECDDNTSPDFTGYATATDICDGDPVITFSDMTTSGSCPQAYTITRTWIASNACDLFDTCVQIITVIDTTAPVITCPIDITLECSDSTDPLNTGTASATDNCDTEPAITFGDVITAGSCPQASTITRTWTATDACGNSSTCNQILLIQDTTPPTITCAVQTTPINCPAIPVFIPPTATDACDATVTVTFNDATTQGSCAGTYNVTRTWTASDDCGNTATCSGTIVVQDVTPPTITCEAQTTPIDCPAVPVFTPPTATDACDATVTITFTDATTQGTCAGTYSVTRTWTATDDCGNTATCSGTIVVRDITSPTITCVAQTTPIDCPAVPVFTPPTATDACDATVTITFTDATTPGSCAGTYSVTRTWTATDDCGNTATCSGTIVVRDITSPTITCVAQTTPIDCPAVPVFTPPTATDACDATVTISFSDATTQGSCAGTYSVTRTWVATDDCGNTSSCSGTIVVRDITPPTITCVAQTTPINCPALPVFAAPTATDACDATVTITFTEATTQGSCAGTYSVTRTWTATDDCGNTSTCSGTVVVQDITPPTITCVAQTTPIDCPAVPVFTPPTATDACDATVMITFADATTQGSCAGTYSVTRTWTATDDCGNTATCSGTVVVRDITPPTITCVAQTTPINCPAVPIFTPPTATDACDATVTVTFNDATTQGSCAGTYSVTRTWTATDDCGNTAACSGTIVVQDITSPTITCVAQTTPIDCPAVPIFTPPTATDACDATVTITFADATTQGTCAGTYSVTRTWTATDDCGNTATCSGTIVVRDVTPPTITCVAQTTPVNCPAVPVFTPPIATDACDPTVTVTFNDITTQGTCVGTYSVTRTWTATDDCGNTATCSGTIVVQDITPPTITCVAQTTPIDCPAVPVFAPPTATDACDVSVTISFTDATTQGSCAGTYSVTRTWTATDDCGNTSTCSGTIVVRDITPPTITCVAQTTPINCPAVPAFAAPTATDACDATVTITFTDATTQGSCAGTYSVTRTWTATDDCGNTATCSGTIVVRDITSPTITCATQTSPINCPAVPVFTPPTATDACDATVTITFSDITTQGTCTGTYSVTRTWTATDDCGNTATCSGTIVVQDITPPTIACPGNITVSCASQVPPVNTGSVTASDLCGGQVTVVHVGDVITNQTCTNRFIVTRTYRATDACGNSTTCAQVITVFDNTVPTITCPPNITIAFGANETPQSTGTATGADNCAGTPTITFADVVIPGVCAEIYTIQRTWTATDACGNIATCLQTIDVQGNCLVDLSLTKIYIDAGPVEGGDDIDFVITVTNEGLVTVGSVVITDYIPLGFSLDDPDWTPGNAGSTGQSASITLSIANGGLDPSGLNPGESVSVYITLQADADIQPGVYVNTAEISFIFDLNGNDISNADIDSDPDNIDTNDPPGEDDIDAAQICVLPEPVISGDGYVCPGQSVIYSVNDYNPAYTYIWALNGGGQIIQDNGSDIEVLWQDDPGGPFQVSVTVVLAQGCQSTAYFFVYIQGVETLVCNDLVQISLDENCQAVILSGMILEGEAEGNNNYYVVIKDMDGNVIPNATLTYEHIGQMFIVSVQNECNDQSCWGKLIVEDKIPPVIACTDAVVPCGTPLDPVYTQPITGSISQTITPGSSIGPNAGAITAEPLDINVPSNAIVTDVNVTVDLEHTWSGDLNVVLISPNGTSITLANAVCGSADNWENVTFDDEAGTPISAACNVAPPPAILQGFVIPEEALSAFDGEFADGTWTLQITDLADQDGGTLNLVTLNINYIESLPYAPEANDACGTVTLTYTETETGEACDDIIITRAWTATDGSGNTATCNQTITILPLNLNNVVFPANYIGHCGESTSPEYTGWPTVNGTEVTDENALCNIFLGYWDKELAECGGGRKILRTWTILDWCTVELIEGEQVIKLTDTEPPVLTCPQDLVVGTDFWYCYANVSVPKPDAYDACSAIAEYSLTANGGTIVSFGDNYVIDGLQLGTYTVTWTVTDECGNSSSCSFHITVIDDVVPVVNCDQHTIVSLTNDGPSGITLVPATVFDDGSYDNCGPVTFRARRMDSCIDFDWTTEGACIDDQPGGIPPVNSRDRGTVHRPCVPFSCCDVGAGPVMVELEVTDAAGNVNYCMIEAEVQDKISPFVECPSDIIVSCDFWFHVEEGTFTDTEGNNNGNLDEDPMSVVFGNMYDAFRYDENIRKNIIINDPANEQYNQPHNWGLDGWADDNCEVNLQVRVKVTDDCSGGDLPGNAPLGAVKLIERRFSASDGNAGIAPGTCTQRIWVVDFDPFYITDKTCNNSNPNDGVIWPCDVLLTTCPEDLGNTGEPVLFDDACSLIGVTYEDTRFDFVDGACFKILRTWAVIDWCQYDSQTGEGIWHYTQVIKVHDQDGPAFVDCPTGPVTLCVADQGVSLPDNNQAFLGEENPLASSCSVHLNLTRIVHETCSDVVQYDVKIYPFNGTDYILIQPTTSAVVDENNDAILSFNTRESSIPSVRKDGLPYNSPWCGDYHRILWSVEDGCGNWSHCEYLLRLEDCKQPSPVCINGLSTVVMPIGGQVTVWAKDFNASSFDDCTPSENLLYSFSGDAYQPSFTYTCENVPAFGVELSTQIWVADGGVDHNCNGQIEWSERNKDYCTTTIVITDNNDVCGGSGSVLAGEVLTDHTQAVEKVNMTLSSPGHFFPTFTTATNGAFRFFNVPTGQDYVITPERNDDHRNGVSTLDLVRIQKHLLGIEPFTSPCQYIAADANNNQQVSAIDLIEIRKLILGIYTQYPANTSWRFVEKGFELDPFNPWPFSEKIQIPALAQDSIMHNDFTAVKVGDVNNTAKANALQIQPRDGRRILHVKAMMKDEVVKGEIVEMQLTLPEILNGFQWTFETQGLEFEGIHSDDIRIDEQHIGLIRDGVVTMSWNNDFVPVANANSQMIFTIRWKATASGHASDLIHLTSKVTPAEAYAINDEVMDVKLAFENEIGTSEFALYQNKPNPWNGQTVIGFDLPEAGNAVLTIFDVAGKEVAKISGTYKAGYNTITLTEKEIPSIGVMYYRLESGEYSASKKMVMIK